MRSLIAELGLAIHRELEELVSVAADLRDEIQEANELERTRRKRSWLG